MGAAWPWGWVVAYAAFFAAAICFAVYATRRAKASDKWKVGQCLACLVTSLWAYYLVVDTLRDAAVLAFANWMAAGAYADARDIWRKARQPKNQDKI